MLGIDGCVFGTPVVPHCVDLTGERAENESQMQLATCQGMRLKLGIWRILHWLRGRIGKWRDGQKQ